MARASALVVHIKKRDNVMASSFHFLAKGEPGTEFDDPRFLCNLHLIFAKPGETAATRVQEFLDKVKEFTLWHDSFDI